MEIKVLGTGCAKCKTTYQTIEKVISENNLEDVKLTKVEDIVEILNSGIMATPAVVVDGAVKVKGHVPSEKELKILFWMIVVYAAVFFMPLGNERFMTAVDATLDLAKWYAQEHVMLCLLPTFFIAGVIAVFVSQGSVLKYFGANAKKWLSYTAAAVSGSILAVCSCTILPLFTSIYKRGAGLGPAIAFLYSGPAISILSIILTARILGVEMGVARTVGAIGFSVVIALLWHLFSVRKRKPNKRNR